MKKPALWKPRASLEVRRRRAALQASIRAFFAARDVDEVETPILSTAGTVDPQIDSFQVGTAAWLQTSPEFAMKRLVAAGSGPIFQIARVFRVDEAGRHHNPEFSLLEWYRPGWDHHALMDEVESLLVAVAGETLQDGMPFPRITYREAFRQHAGVDPFSAPVAALGARCRQAGIELEAPPGDALRARDFHLDLLMGAVVGPALGRGGPEFLLDYPASQCALARVSSEDPTVAERFELFWDGVELANGFHELADAAEQRRRFEAEQARRMADRRPTPPWDRHLVDALDAGFPDCAGVALGLDRLLMRLLGLDDVRDTLSFDWERA